MTPLHCTADSSLQLDLENGRTQRLRIYVSSQRRSFGVSFLSSNDNNDDGGSSNDDQRVTCRNSSTKADFPIFMYYNKSIKAAADASEKSVILLTGRFMAAAVWPVAV